MAVLELLRSRRQPLGVGEVAQHVGLHQNTARSHLDLLVEAPPTYSPLVQPDLCITTLASWPPGRPPRPGTSRPLR